MKLSKFGFALALTLWLMPSAIFAQQPRVWYGKQRVHPTRLLALATNAVAPASNSKATTKLTASQLSALQTAAAQVSEKVTRNYALVPGLVVLEPEMTAAALTVTGATAKSKPDIKERIRALLATGAFKYVEPDYELTTALTPSDARFTDGTLWGLKNTGQSGGVVGADINAEAGWNITTGSPV
jgi:hypothetical protein